MMQCIIRCGAHEINNIKLVGTRTYCGIAERESRLHGWRDGDGTDGRVHDGATHRHDLSMLRALGVKLIGPRCDRSFAMRAHGVSWV